jgi:hypothetical protein
MIGRDAIAIANGDPEIRSYREGSGSAVKSWIDFESVRLMTAEYYFAIPHTKAIWVFLFVDERIKPMVGWSVACRSWSSTTLQ